MCIHTIEELSRLRYNVLMQDNIMLFKNMV